MFCFSRMPFLDTAPADIDRADPGSAWSRFRIDDARRVLMSLHTLSRSDAPVTIGLAQGPTFVASLWTVDEVNRVLHFSLDHSAVVDSRLLRSTKLWAVGYEDGAKLQFDLRHFALEEAAPCTGHYRGHYAAQPQRLLHCTLPQSLYRLPRRDAVRVRPTELGAPKLRFRHPLAPERWTQMRAIDIGPHGCALWRPMDSLPLPPGMVLMQAEVELDDQTYFYADLQVQHVTLGAPVAGQVQGMRVGCRWDGLAPPAELALAHWIRGGQGRRQRLSLSFDSDPPPG
jgi:flagellar brake protein